MKLLTRLRRATAVISLFSAFSAVHAESNYVLVPLPQGVSVQLPKNWTALNANQRVTLGAAVEAILEKRKVEGPGPTMPFAANYFDANDKVAAIFNVMYIADATLTQVEASAFTPQQMTEVGETFRQQISKDIPATGNSLIEWRGTRKATINGLTAFVTEYRRTSPQKVPFRAQLVRVLNGSKSFEVTLSYREGQDSMMVPIVDKVIGSIRQRGAVMQERAARGGPAQQTPAVIDAQSGSVITVIAGSHVTQQVSGLGQAWLARIQVVDKTGQVVSLSPVVVGGCTAGPLGPLGNMVSINGAAARSWRRGGDLVIDKMAELVCSTAPLAP